MRALILTIISSFFIFNSQNAQGSTTEDRTGDRVFAKVQPYTFKVKTSPSADSPQASYGTGFVVDPQGLLISNYHVVSDSIVDPKKNKIFVMIENEAVAGQVLAIDIVHDLSLIRVDKKFSKSLQFSSEKPHQGEPIYSIGQPEDLNMSIISGTYNNELDFGDYKIIHLSAPINSGMSGGPTVNQKGELVGVNVSKLLFANNVSFAVPARFAQELYQKNKDRKERPEHFWNEMQSQLTKLQKGLSDTLLDNADKKRNFYGWNIPQLPSSMKCWSVGDKRTRDDAEKYDYNEESCDLQHSSFLSEGNETGTYSFSVRNVENKTLNAWQFFKLLSESKGLRAFKGGSTFNELERKPNLLTRGECFSDVMVNKQGLKFKVGYCARDYTYFSGLQDAHVAIVSFDSSKKSIFWELEFEGFAQENILKIIKQFVANTERAEKL
ncbi:MAG: S1 family peptidase [Pseudobdellovibrio sp.]